MRSKRLAVAVMMAAMMLVACKDGSNGKHWLSTVNESTGKPYEVLVASEDSIAARIIRQALEKTVEGLPQEEPFFDVSSISTHRLDAMLRRARNLVIVKKAEKPSAKTSIRMKENLYAKPQTVVYISIPSNNRLQTDLLTKGAMLRKLLEKGEQQTAVEQLKNRHNEKAEAMIQKMFGVNMLIPADMTSWKEGHDFLWLSNNSPTRMQSICLYQCHNATPMFNNKDSWVRVRDSVMRVNIPGEEPNMYMTTGRASLSEVQGSEGTRYELRGLWEMKDDMMGGPFVSIALTKGGKQVVAEAFVYAPSEKKRNLLRQLEASLQTLSP